MEIHKPKPIHNWREFLKEVGIIVLGVSIALAGEQAVEHWREHRQYVEARDAMRSELASNVANLSQRPTISACVGKRIAELTALLDKAERQEAFDAPRWIGIAGTPRLRFVAETDVGRSGLFSPAEQRQFGNVYSFMHNLDLEADRERQAWARLQVLEGRTGVPPEMIGNLREALAQVSYEDARIATQLNFIMLYAEPLSLKVPTLDPGLWPDSWPLCLPLDTPRAEAVRRSTYHMDLVRRAYLAQE